MFMESKKEWKLGMWTEMRKVLFWNKLELCGICKKFILHMEMGKNEKRYSIRREQIKCSFGPSLKWSLLPSFPTSYHQCIYTAASFFLLWEAIPISQNKDKLFREAFFNFLLHYSIPSPSLPRHQTLSFWKWFRREMCVTLRHEFNWQNKMDVIVTSTLFF